MKIFIASQNPELICRVQQETGSVFRSSFHLGSVDLSKVQTLHLMQELEESSLVVLDYEEGVTLWTCWMLGFANGLGVPVLGYTRSTDRSNLACPPLTDIVSAANTYDALAGMAFKLGQALERGIDVYAEKSTELHVLYRKRLEVNSA